MSAAKNVVDVEFGDPQPRSVDAPALGFSIQVDLGAGRTAVMQTHLPNDCALADLNRMFDKLTAAGDRQRAHYKIEEEERALELIQKEQRQKAEDMLEVDKRFKAEQQARVDEAARRQLGLDSALEGLRNAHAASGRRQEFVLAGRDKSNANTTQTAIEALKQEIVNKRAEYDEVCAQNAKLMARWVELVARHMTEIARLRAIVDSGTA